MYIYLTLYLYNTSTHISTFYSLNTIHYLPNDMGLVNIQRSNAYFMYFFFGLILWEEFEGRVSAVTYFHYNNRFVFTQIEFLFNKLIIYIQKKKKKKRTTDFWNFILPTLIELYVDLFVAFTENSFSSWLIFKGDDNTFAQNI